MMISRSFYNLWLVNNFIKAAVVTVVLDFELYSLEVASYSVLTVGKTIVVLLKNVQPRSENLQSRSVRNKSAGVDVATNCFVVTMTLRAFVCCTQIHIEIASNFNYIIISRFLTSRESAERNYHVGRVFFVL